VLCCAVLCCGPSRPALSCCIVCLLHMIFVCMPAVARGGKPGTTVQPLKERDCGLVVVGGGGVCAERYCYCYCYIHGPKRAWTPWKGPTGQGAVEDCQDASYMRGGQVVCHTKRLLLQGSGCLRPCSWLVACTACQVQGDCLVFVVCGPALHHILYTHRVWGHIGMRMKFLF